MFASTAELFAFAEAAVCQLKLQDPSFICEGLVWVDIFCTESGKLVVNEFESLEAAYNKSFKDELILSVALSRYWQGVLRHCIMRFILDTTVS